MILNLLLFFLLAYTQCDKTGQVSIVSGYQDTLSCITLLPLGIPLAVRMLTNACNKQFICCVCKVLPLCGDKDPCPVLNSPC